MKRTITVLLAACLLLGVMSGCVTISVREAASVEEGTESTSAEEAPEAASDEAASETEPEPPAEPPSVEYDARSQTIYVKGTNDFSAISFPEEVRKARVLEVEGDGFKLSAYLVMLRELGLDEQAELPGLIDRTAKSLRFLREYLRDHAGAAYPSALAELPVDVKIDNTYGYRTDEDRITLKLDEVGTHREFLYLFALMNSDAVGWEHFGYAWYVGTCIDPYNEAISEWPITPELPYYTQCIAGGVDPDNMTAADLRTVYDACARVCFEKGLTGWGSFCESRPVTEEFDFSRMKDKEPGDTLLTAFAAASFLAWLDEAYGFESLSLFCFGQKTFEEAFGMSFNAAYKSWRIWIMENYPAE